MKYECSSDLPGQLPEPPPARPGRVEPPSKSEMDGYISKDWNSPHAKANIATKGATGKAFGRQG